VAFGQKITAFAKTAAVEPEQKWHQFCDDKLPDYGQF
jgi:hypothetical protein